MADVTYPSGTAIPNQGSAFNYSNSNLGLVTPTPPDNARVGSGVALVDIPACSPCRFVSPNGIALSSGAANDGVVNVVDGWSVDGYKAGDTLTLYTDVNLAYGTGITVPQKYYLSTTPGLISTTTTTGGTLEIARGVPDNSQILIGGTRKPVLRVKRQ